MAERHSESVKEKLSLSLDEIIALNNKQQKQQQQKQQQQHQDSSQQGGGGPLRRRRNNPPVASPYARRVPIHPYPHNGVPAVGYSVKVLGLPTGLPWPRLEGMLRRSFGYCGTILAVVPRKDGEAWIQFADVAACRTALAEMQNAKVGGHAVSVERGNRIPTSAPTVGGGMWGSPTPMWTASGPYAFSSNTVNTLAGSFAPPFSRQIPLPVASGPTVSLSSPPKTMNTANPRHLRRNAGSTVIVSNVPLDLTTEEISDAFSCVGGVAGCDLLLNSSGVHTGRVAVSFSRRSEAMEAVRRFDGGDLNGQVIRVFLE
ncbi:uncharacterized protein LOC34621590 [Cyclospora cayetanensis]|uniref:Uncharacterized protein LOC34621590 n=1 Tax=Cyclospora cayetanensis TaxID=88456 RepID=A0A6P6RRN1_9EIME|nr:uncharacterized protein LOC34621590 [Cyclospora cayetanensis]